MHQLNDVERKWFNQIQEARESGLSDWEWCRQNNIATSTFYYHIRKLRDKLADLPASRNTVLPEMHEVVKVEVREDERLPAVAPCSDHQDPASQITSLSEPCSITAPADFSARIQIGSITVDFSNSACDRIILSVINALRKSC